MQLSMWQAKYAGTNARTQQLQASFTHVQVCVRMRVCLYNKQQMMLLLHRPPMLGFLLFLFLIMCIYFILFFVNVARFCFRLICILCYALWLLSRPAAHFASSTYFLCQLLLLLCCAISCCCLYATYTQVCLLLFYKFLHFPFVALLLQVTESKVQRRRCGGEWRKKINFAWSNCSQFSV